MESLCFPKDRDIMGNELRRDTFVSHETRQRAKCLTHQHQQQLRQERIEGIHAERHRKAQEEREKLVGKYESYKEVVKKLCDEQEKCPYHEKTINDSTIENFATLSKEELLCFIIAKRPLPKIPHLPKNKGKLDQAKNGEQISLDLLLIYDMKQISDLKK